jgi:hypothetical protein
VQFHAFNSIAEAREFLASEAERRLNQGASRQNATGGPREGGWMQVLVIMVRT